MAITVRTERFEFSHGKKPKGTGWWAFEFSPGHGEDDVTFFAPCTMSFREACAWARKEVRRRGFQDATVHAAP